MTTTLLPYSGDKNLEEIQEIVTSTKIANMTKQATGQIVDLSMIAKKRPDNWQQPKSRTIEKCFNCDKRGHYAKNFHSTTKRKFEDERSILEVKRIRWNNNSIAKKASAIRLTDQDNMDDKPYPPERAFMTQIIINKPNTYNLNFYLSRHICNDQDLFLDLRPKNYEFITAVREVIRSHKVGTIHLFL